MTVDPELLRSATVFSALSVEELSTMAGSATETRHAPGEALTEEGAYGHRFHLLLDGAADVVRGGERVASIGPGEFVGEVQLLGGGRATATVVCTEPIRCVTLRREEFWDVLEKEPAIALRILEVVCRRLSQEFIGDHQSNLGTG